ncbi:MAG: ferredoxin--nitrite reductase [Thaumarchaeota archaeon 13_1_40CM_4_38_7]|nr:MAG: ferredoxin--nitrite reductase [Thaumarchaeota archaeon 13_1_40CM_4_38_7]OLC94528.1 MAG: ferredoxin--nitrite reductase [Thaumarchaeota archaeon 13_1_40CM_3_38_6]
MSKTSLSQSKPDNLPKPKINWAKVEESEKFAEMVKLFRQGKINRDDFRRFRLQHGAYGSRMTDDYSMIRIKIPAGEVYPEQIEKIAELSESFSIGNAHVSTRQNFQLHWVALEDVSEVMRGLTEVGLTSREACGNTVRNVMCSPIAGVCPDEIFDPTPYAMAATRFLLRNPMNQSLPRKFKINFTCCEKHGMARIADIGLIPHKVEVNGKSQNGFKIFLGGGLGAQSFVGHHLEEFTSDEDLLYTIISVIRVYDRMGNRENMARNRMRYLVNELGWEKFQNIVLKERAVVRATQSVVIKLELDKTSEVLRKVSISSEMPSHPTGFPRWLKTNAVKQKQPGFSIAFLTLESGDVTANQLRIIADIAREFSAEGRIRNGFAQDIVFRWVRDEDLPKLYARLLEAGLANPGALTMASVIGCSGTTSCNLALTNSHRLAKEVQRKFLELKLDEDDDLRDSTIKISGCPNSCGQHEIATIGFYGGGGRLGKDMYPLYTMSLGGRADEKAMLGLICMKVPTKRVIPTIIKIVEIFKSEKRPGETLDSWVHRIIDGNGGPNVKSLNDIKELLKPVVVAPTIDQDKDFYVDYGNDGSYHAKTGRGECAA